MSHPSWVCGLKPESYDELKRIAKSHPSWVCGLKLSQGLLAEKFFQSHPSWVCGLKPLISYCRHNNVRHTLRGCVD